jgi:predicted nucleic acid-binding protein
MIIILDATAWFAYFNGTAEGEVVRDYLQRADEAVTPASVVAEVTEAARHRKENPAEFLQFIESRSRVEPITADVALRAGKLLANQPGGPMRVHDAFVVATAQAIGGRVVSLNPALEGLEDIVPLG